MQHVLEGGKGVSLPVKVAAHYDWHTFSGTDLGFDDADQIIGPIRLHGITFSSRPSVDADEQTKKPEFSMKIVKELHRSLYLFEQIGVASTNTRRAILRNVPTIFYRNIKSLCLGLLHGQIEFSNYYKQKLEPHAKLVRGVSKTPDSKLKDHIIKHANGVGAFLKRVLPIITPRLVALI